MGEVRKTYGPLPLELAMPKPLEPNPGSSGTFSVGGDAGSGKIGGREKMIAALEALKID